MTLLKTTFSKNKPREIVYRNYKYFNSQNFNDELQFVLSKENIDSCSKFKISEYPQKLKILKTTFSWFTVFLFD